MESSTRSVIAECDPEPLDQEYNQDSWNLMICILGEFRLTSCGRYVALNGTGKGGALLRLLATRPYAPVAREAIVEELWPNNDGELAAQSLNSLVYSLHKQLGDYLNGAAPIIYCEGLYRLNLHSGIGVDSLSFAHLAKHSENLRHTGQLAESVDVAEQAIQYYRGDLNAGSHTRVIVEREHLRTVFISLLVHLATYHYAQGDYNRSLDFAQQILTHDPCREDAHRVIMRCYVKRNERAAALRQHALCTQILQKEYAATPEPATMDLYNQIRNNPSSI